MLVIYAQFPDLEQDVNIKHDGALDSRLMTPS